MHKVPEDEILIKQDAQTDEKYGCAPEKREIKEYIRNGIINLDKPRGPTSHEIAAWVRNIFKDFGVAKAGHSGTLDPNVTGVLPMCIQNSVKIIPALIRAEKEYVALMHLHKPVAEKEIREAFRKFLGKIKQMPPKKSGVKKQLRTRKIYYANILEISGQDVLFRVGCEAGTYVRTLCIDIGKSLGCGAHMQELRRTKAGNFEEADSVNLQAVKDAVEVYLEKKDETPLRRVVIPVECGIRHLRKIIIRDNAVSAVSNGAPLHIGGVSRVSAGIVSGEMVGIMTLKGELAALGSAQMATDEMMKAEHGIAAKVSRVVIAQGLYPRAW